MTDDEQLEPISLAKAETFVFRARIDAPLRTSFGTMYDRPSVLVRLEDKDGDYGWGEVWCNFPSVGAEHRARLIVDVLIPLLFEKSSIHPTKTLSFLSQKTHILTIQSGEPGPLSQAIAGLDIAIWDLMARKIGKPLYTLFSNKEVEKVPVYASGINPDESLKTVSDCRKKGYRAFKLKVGFGPDIDFPNITRVANQLCTNEVLMLDANQAWNLAEAKDFIHKIANDSFEWLEEPLAADRPESEWAELSLASPIPLAAGENIRGIGEFVNKISIGHIAVIQPDACKWGGVTGCLLVAQKALEAGKRYCPHYLGGGIGLLASAHILAAAGGNGLLELDINPNPLREGLAISFPEFKDGHFILPNSPGLGVEPDFGIIKKYLVSKYAAASR
jgi:L-alanine-DL-glutamate epimerase-like enolase superfamily enzyme